MTRRIRRAWLLLVFAGSIGCAARRPIPVDPPTGEVLGEPAVAEASPVETANTPTGDAASPEPAPEPAAAPEAPLAPEPSRTEPTDLERLGELAKKRSTGVDTGGASIGPGDLVKLTVSDVPELNLETRVGTDGKMLLPLIGAFDAGGKSEAQLSAEISRLLVEKRFVRSPRVAVFIAEPKSQQVAVTGAVNKPGMFALTRERSTIIDMLSEAGGLSKEAGEVVQFLPADESSAGPGGAPNMAGAIQLDVNELFRGRNRAILNLKVVSGDVIFVPDAGSFTINGWIEKPGTYPLTRRTAILAAIASAGGPLFPARLGRVEVLREGVTSGDPPTVIQVNVQDVEAGKIPDVTLRAGDVVRIPAWPHLLPPWAIYSVVKNLISISAGIPIF